MIFVSGCNENDETVFFKDRNFEDQEEILKTVNLYQNGVNTKNLHTIMLSFGKDFSMPDDNNSGVVHSYKTIENDFKNFFDRSSNVQYVMDDVFMTINENRTRVDLRLGRQYTGHTPFNYNVNDTGYEKFYLEKTEDGKWYFSTITHRMLPPVITAADSGL